MTAWTAPAVIGCCRVDGVREFLPLSEAEIQRSARALDRVLRTFDLPARSHVLITSLASQVCHFMPLERALAELHCVVSYADSTFFDAARVVMFARRYNVRAILGVTAEMLDGLRAIGADPAEVFSGRIVWATPEARRQLKILPGEDLRTCSELGPAFGVECAYGGGMHLSSEEWSTKVVDGELVLTSRLPRLREFSELRTGFAARVVDEVCPCGSTDIRIEPA